MKLQGVIIDEWWMSMRFIGFETSTQQKFHKIDTHRPLALLGFVALNPTYRLD